MTEAEVLILGSGPAGAAVAIGLRRLGYRVLLVGEPRPFDALEGVSERVVQGMQGAGLVRALQVLAAPSRRQVTWNGQTSAANTERLVPRQQFDQALLEDLREQGVQVVQGRVSSWRETAQGHQVRVMLSGGGECRLTGGFLVEARGRAAPAAGLPRVMGAKTLSLLQYWQGPAAPACSAVQSFADGWAWMARRDDGRCYLQLTLDAASTELPPKQALADWCRRRLAALEQAQPFIAGAQPCGEVHARISTPVLCERSTGERWLRVGDAAMAVDPLSGNGIFQALSSALQAPAVINTLIRRPERAALARRFHEARIEGLFYRFARIGRDFYAQERRWSQRPFWRARRDWPDCQPLHLPVTPDRVTIETRPVVEQGLVREAQVVVTPDQPQGVWHLQGQPLAPLLEAVRAAPGRCPTVVLSEKLGDQQGPGLARWMAQQGWILLP